MEYRIPDSKVRSYLLTNPRKCGFFLAAGYSTEDWALLRDDLLRIAAGFPARLRRGTPHGDEYEIVGNVLAPSRRIIKLRTGWMIRANEAGIMSFVTAYPA